MVFIDPRDRNLVKARNDTTGLIEYSSQDATNVIQYAISALNSGGSILIQSGTYTLSSSLVSNGKNGVELYGEGNLTVLRLAGNVNKPLVILQSARDWHIHDLQIDGNKTNQSSNSQSSYGICAWNCTNIVVERNYIHDCRTFGIGFSASSDSKILNNYVKDSGANGITIDNQGGGGGNTVEGNVVDGASDVGITAWVGKDLLVAGNQVMNINHNDSPFADNSHLGMMAEGTSTLGSTRVTFNGNTVTACAGSGFSSLSSAGAVNTQISVEGNKISNCATGVHVGRTNGCLVKANLIETTSERGIAVGLATTGVQIVGNELYDIGGPSGIEASINGLLIDGNTLKTVAGNGIVGWGSSDWIVTGNQIETVNGGSGILLVNASNEWTVRNNTILKCTRDGIFIDANSDHNTIDHNRVSGCTTGVRISSQAENNIVTSNILEGNTASLIDNGTGTLKADNVVGSE